MGELDIVGANRGYIRNILASRSAAGEIERAVKFIEFQQQAGAGKIVRYDSKVKMAGAENRGAVTCYLDSLLFAMFARFDAFERMLKKEFEDESRRKLATVLRLWVNLLRSGELIRTDTVGSDTYRCICVGVITDLLPRSRPNFCKKPSPNAAGRKLDCSNSKTPLRLSTSLQRR